jgi:acetyl esterase/lipase
MSRGTAVERQRCPATPESGTPAPVKANAASRVAPWASALCALGCALGCHSSAPFTRERAVEQLRSRFPGATLPSDALPSGVLADEEIVYVREPERELRLDVYRPAGEGPHPGLIVVHGGGWQSGDRTMERPLAKRLATLGYVAAPVSYRLGREGRFPAALDDLRAAVRWMRENAPRYAIDAEHIGAVGGSAGGQLVALLGATDGATDSAVSCDVQAVVDIDGLADFTGQALVDKEAAQPASPTRFLGGSYQERPDVWRDASAISHVGPRSAPTLFINSTAPTPILPGRAEMCDKLKALGIDCAIVVVPDTPHPFWLMEPWFDVTVETADRFLRQHLRRP